MVGDAVIEGLFGVRWTREEIVVTPRLRSEEGYVYLPLPGTGQFVAYRYRPAPGERALRLEWSAALRTPVRIFLPDPHAGLVVEGATWDGKQLAFTRQATPEAGVMVHAPQGSGVLEVRYRGGAGAKARSGRGAGRGEERTAR